MAGNWSDALKYDCKIPKAVQVARTKLIESSADVSVGNYIKALDAKAKA